MIASLTQFTRFGHLAYYPLAGGDKASKEAVRPLLGLLKQAYGSDFELGRFSWLLERIEPDRAKLRLIDEQIDRRLNVVNTSSLGRVFDAVAAMLGLGNFNHFDAQLPMALESVVDPSVGDFYEFALHRMGDRSFQLDLGDLIQGVVEDVYRERPSRIVAAKFHNTLVEALLAMARTAANTTGLEVTALSGGVFCNRFLTARLVAKLNRAGFVVLVNRDVPANDGGLALGQAAIAAAILKEETATHLSLARS